MAATQMNDTWLEPRLEPQEDTAMVFIVLWLLGVPVALIVLLWLLGVFS